jgi:hypothetical protein
MAAIHLLWFCGPTRKRIKDGISELFMNMRWSSCGFPGMEPRIESSLK